MKLSTGIDVSKKELEVKIFDGQKHKKGKVYCNTIKGILELHNDLKELTYCEMIITMEATGTYHLKVAKMLYQFGYQVSVVNPLIIKRYSEMKMLRAKTDSVDARLIAEYGYFEKPIYFKPKSKEMELILQLSKAIEGLIKLKIANSNRLEALQQDPDLSDEIVTILLSIDESIKSTIVAIEKRIKELMKNNETYKLLRTIPGIGKRIAPVIVSTFGDFDTFTNSKQVASFIGINPSPFESGSSIKGKGKISKKGNCYLRKLIYMASVSAMVHNKPCNVLYTRLISNGKIPRVALIAVSNKLIRQMFAVVKYRNKFDPDYHAQLIYKSA